MVKDFPDDNSKIKSFPFLKIDLIVFPFNPLTKIQYNTGKIGFGALKIYNISGKPVFSENIKDQGIIEWNASGLASGVYIVKAKIGNKIYSRILLLQK